MELLLNITLRPLLLATVAAVGLWVFRIRSAPARHAVWTLVTGGMLLQAVLIPLLPAVRLRVLRPVTVQQRVASVVASSIVVVSSAPARRPSVDQVAGCIYAIGFLWCAAQLAYAGWFTRRLVHDSVPAGGRRYESRRIAVPVTVGGRILLPLGWREWDAEKLAAVLAHEEAHVGRADWAVAVVARMNRCVFWFHPLAWWLDRVLARLAEQACDDAALAVTPDREKYASVLLEMARAAGSRGGRVVGAIAMAKETNVETRINRILDASRRVIPKPLGRAGWCGLSVCGGLLMYAAAVVQLAPAQVGNPVVAREPRLMAQAAAPRPTAPARQAAPEDAASGVLSGIVLDPSGARVPYATVMAQGITRRFTTSANALGEWLLAGVPAGSYSLSIQSPGFATNRRDGIEVAAGAERKIDANLEIGSASEAVTVTAAGSPTRELATSQSPSPRVGGNVQPLRLLRNIFPAYPAAARDQGISGPVVISAVIGKDGTVVHSQVKNDAPAELRDAALAAVQGWIYAPALLNGQPVEVLTTITINFQLSPQ